tara:strand:- start:4587 stop:4850 length:264 start_codon:yes stop_codon:yes gene_type:complete
MNKSINIFMLLLIGIFILSIFKYYSSNKNLDTKNFNRSNIDQILKSKINNLPILSNDTDNVIEFNNSIEEDINQEKNRNFWNLLKIK